MTPRFMYDTQLQEHFGLSDRGLCALRSDPRFPTKDPLLKRTDSKAVHAYFDKRSGLGGAVDKVTIDGEENWEDESPRAKIRRRA